MVIINFYFWKYQQAFKIPLPHENHLYNRKFLGQAFQLCDYSPMSHFVNVHLPVIALYVTAHYTDGLIQGRPSSGEDVFTLREVG